MTFRQLVQGKLELADHCERSNLELMNELIQIMKSEKENGFVIEVIQ